MSNFILCICFLGLAFGAPNKYSKDIEEIPDLFEGDIILPPSAQNGLIGQNFRWPNATVYYELDPTFSLEEIEKIFNGWMDIVATSCIVFIPKTDANEDYVFIQRGEEGSGCYSSVGRQGGRQTINLEAPSCTNRHGTITHEMLHTLGFFHEQSRPDRDDYVEIIWDKIQEGKEHNFDKHTEEEVSFFGAPYDYGSVLHYSARGFSTDGISDTIVPKIPGVEIGQRVRISQLDSGKLRLMYNCP